LEFGNFPGLLKPFRPRTTALCFRADLRFGLLIRYLSLSA